MNADDTDFGEASGKDGRGDVEFVAVPNPRHSGMTWDAVGYPGTGWGTSGVDTPASGQKRLYEIVVPSSYLPLSKLM